MLSKQIVVRSKPKIWLHYFAVFLSFLIVMLLVAGALVTSNEAGDSVPDWPLSFGRWLIHSDNFVANVRYEYSHRFIAGVVGFTIFILALCMWFYEPRRWVKKLAGLAFFGVVAQAAVGGLRVLLPAYKPEIAVPHALIAQSFFAVVVALAVFTSRGWFVERDVRKDDGGARVRSLTVATIGAVLLQLVLGAGFRHGAWGILPHVIGAIVVAGLMIWTAAAVLIRHDDRWLRRPAWSVLGLIFLQVGLGIATYFARAASKNDPQPLEPMISLTAAHVVVGALTLAAMVVLTLRCYKALAPESAGAEARATLSPARKATV